MRDLLARLRSSRHKMSMTRLKKHVRKLLHPACESKSVALPVSIPRTNTDPAQDNASQLFDFHPVIQQPVDAHIDVSALAHEQVAKQQTSALGHGAETSTVICLDARPVTSDHQKATSFSKRACRLFPTQQQHDHGVFPAEAMETPFLRVGYMVPWYLQAEDLSRKTIRSRSLRGETDMVDKIDPVHRQHLADRGTASHTAHVTLESASILTEHGVIGRSTNNCSSHDGTLGHVSGWQRQKQDEPILSWLAQVEKSGIFSDPNDQPWRPPSQYLSDLRTIRIGELTHDELDADHRRHLIAIRQQEERPPEVQKLEARRRSSISMSRGRGHGDPPDTRRWGRVLGPHEIRKIYTFEGT